MSRDKIKVGFFPEDTTYQADSVLHCAFLPTVVGSAEVGVCIQDIVGSLVLDVLRAVVIGDGASSVPWIVRQRSQQRPMRAASSALRHLRNVGQSALAFDTDVECGTAPAGNDGISFPVTELPTSQYMLGALRDGNSLRNVQTSMSMTVPFLLASFVCSHQMRDQILIPTNVPVVDELVNGLVADAQLWMNETESTSPATAGLWRPSQFEFGDDVATDSWILESKTTMSMTLAFLGSCLCAVSQVDVVDGGLVSAQLPRDRTWISPKLSGNLVHRDSLCTQVRNPISFIGQEVDIAVGSHRHLG